MPFLYAIISALPLQRKRSEGGELVELVELPACVLALVLAVASLHGTRRLAVGAIAELLVQPLPSSSNDPTSRHRRLKLLDLRKRETGVSCHVLQC